jgi:hypothetical protein
MGRPADCSWATRTDARPQRHWTLALFVVLPTATALACVVAQAQELSLARPDSFNSVVSADTLLDAGQVTDGASLDVSADAIQPPAEQGPSPRDGGAQPETDRQTDSAVVAAAAVDVRVPLSPQRGAGVVSAEVHAQAQAPAVARTPLAGVGLDFGVSGVLPDAGLLLTVRPASWAHLQLGPGYNGLSFGIRGGATVVNPIAIPFSLTLEGGHYYEGDANQAVHWFSPQTNDVASLRHFSYDFVNLLGGLVFQGRHVCFYIRGGVTWMRTTVKDFGQSVREVAQIDLQAADPKIHYRGPSAKIGLLVFP